MPESGFCAAEKSTEKTALSARIIHFSAQDSGPPLRTVLKSRFTRKTDYLRIFSPEISNFMGLL
jgi:hypothetical protein